MHISTSGHAAARRPGAPCDDAWTIRERNNTIVAALADGVGSARRGGEAARRAVEMLADYCSARPAAWSARRALGEFTAQINRQFHAEALERDAGPELASTLSAVIVEEGRLFGCNVGDSPVYLWRCGRLQQLSQAHTLADDALRHVLTRALGLAPTVEPFQFELELREGDLVLLCSDGVSTPLPESRLNELLSRQASARSIVAAARSLGEANAELADDVSAIVLEVVDPGSAAHTARQRLEVVPPLHAGQRFDGWTLTRPLDAARRVWLAEDAAGQRNVLKFPAAEAQDVPSVRDAFIREAWNATRLVSPDLVRAWTPEGETLRYYRMDYVEAPTLRTVLAQGRLGVEDTRELAAFLLRVGQFLLQHDLAHGDLKPDNLLVLRTGGRVQFRLLDLGSAADLFSVTSRAGTPSYLSPERFRGSALSERTEIFAIGVTLYEALTGTYPFGEVERFQTPRFDASPRRPTRLNAAIPAWLETILLRALEVAPERRYQHFSEMAFDLSHPEKVTAHFAKNTPLLQRNPVLFYQGLAGGFALTSLILLYLLLRR